MNIQDLSADQTDCVDLTILRDSFDVIQVGSMIKGKRLIEGPTTMIHLQYKGFVVEFCVVPIQYQRNWIPDKDYDKNYFCTFFYHGSTTEHSTDGTLLRTFNEGGKSSLLNVSLVTDISTYEVYKNVAWLCFSSYKPYTASLLDLDGVGVIPAGVGAINALGEFKHNETTIKALDYIEPNNYEMEVTGKSKIVLIQAGEFVNKPI